MLDRSWRLWKSRLESAALGRQAVVVLEADFSPEAIGALLALVECGCVVVPIVRSTRADRQRMYRISEAEHRLRITETEDWSLESLPGQPSHALYQTLRARGHPGLVLFSSGTSGEPKAAVHDLVPLLEKFKTRRPTLRTVNFLLFDHIGGFNTLFHTLSNGATVITLEDRSPDAVCAAIQQFKVEVLPASPTFLRILLLSNAQERYDLSSLKVISYGTEPMSETTLQRLHEAFPVARLVQTYGLAEVGILRAQSKSNDSLWVKVGGEGVQTRIVDGMLQRERAARLVAFASRGPNMLTLPEVVDSLIAATWEPRGAPASAKSEALRRVTQRAVADRLLLLAADAEASPEVRAVTEFEIVRLRPVALKKAKQFADGHHVELWQFTRKIATSDHKPRRIFQA